MCQYKGFKLIKLPPQSKEDEYKIRKSFDIYGSKKGIKKDNKIKQKIRMWLAEGEGNYEDIL